MRSASRSSAAARAPRSTSTPSARLWRDDVASFDGEFVHFDAVRVNPKPVHDRRIPIVLGGNSDAALRRVATWGDGWYGFNLTASTRSPNASASCAGCAPSTAAIPPN